MFVTYWHASRPQSYLVKLLLTRSQSLSEPFLHVIALASKFQDKILLHACILRF